MTAAAAVPSYTPNVRRPGLITLLMVLVIISGVLSIIGGILFILMRNNGQVANDLAADGVAPSTGATALLWVGIGSIVVGLIYLLVAKGLGDGNKFSRFIVAFFTVLSVIGGIFTLFGQTGSTRWSGVVSVLIGLAVLGILYSRRANNFYAAR